VNAITPLPRSHLNPLGHFLARSLTLLVFLTSSCPHELPSVVILLNIHLFDVSSSEKVNLMCESTG